MRKASKIIYLVGGILSIVAAVGFLITALIFVILPNTDAFVEAYNRGVADGTISANVTLAEFQGVFAAISVPFFFWMAAAIINSVFSFIASKKDRPSTSLAVLNIVFGVISCVEVNIVASVFAFIANGQEDRRVAQEDK